MVIDSASCVSWFILEVKYLLPRSDCLLSPALQEEDGRLQDGWTGMESRLRNPIRCVITSQLVRGIMDGAAWCGSHMWTPALAAKRNHKLFCEWDG